MKNRINRNLREIVIVSAAFGLVGLVLELALTDLYQGPHIFAMALCLAGAAAMLGGLWAGRRYCRFFAVLLFFCAPYGLSGFVAHLSTPEIGRSWIPGQTVDPELIIRDRARPAPLVPLAQTGAFVLGGLALLAGRPREESAGKPE